MTRIAAALTAISALAASSACPAQRSATSTSMVASSTPVQIEAPPVPPQYAEDAADARGVHRGVMPDVFVSNEDAGTISFIDSRTDSVVDDVAVGTRPRGLKLSPDGALLFVAVSGSPKEVHGPTASTAGAAGAVDVAARADRSKDGIAVVDVAQRRVVRTLPSGIDPEAFDVSTDGHRLYVSNEDAGTLSIVDVDAARIVKSVAVGGEPEGVTVSRDGKLAWVTSERDGVVSVVDVAGDRGVVVATIPTGHRPRSIALTRDGKRAFVGAENDASVRIVDARAKKPTRDVELPKGARPMGLVLSRDDRTLFVSDGRAGNIAVIDVDTGAVRAMIEGVGARPWGMALSPDGTKLFAACGPSNDVAVIDVATHDVVAHIATSARGARSSPWGIAAQRLELRVCADPNNMPFSRRPPADASATAQPEGLDNRIAAIIADALDARLVTAWRPERRGFFRNTVKAGLCDVVVGVPSGADRLATTKPLYRSSYVVVTRADRSIDRPSANDAHAGARFASLDDPALRNARIGLHLMSDDGAAAPPALGLARRGLTAQLVGFPITGNYARDAPPAALIDAVDDGAIDVAIAWGPLAGWFAKTSRHPLRVLPLAPVDDGGLRYDFAAAIGVKKSEPALLHDIERAIDARRADIDRVLDEFGVPRVP